MRGRAAIARRLLLLVGGAALSGAAADLPSANVERAAKWLAAWDSHGPHRTATAGDEAGAAWLAAEAQTAGARPEIEEFPLQRLDRVAAFAEINGERIEGEALFDSPDTPRGGVEGLASLAGAGRAFIGVTAASPLAVYDPDFLRMRRESPHRALVLITEGGAPGLALLNAESFTAPFGPAILQLPSTWRMRVFEAASNGAGFRVVLRSRRTPARARNIVVHLKGTDPSLAPLVVMTPRSSWWQSTSERGGGLVCWLESLRALLARPPARDVVFLASSGHELGHIGLDDFMARRPGWEKRATWVNCGDSIGARDGKLSVQSATDELRRLVPDALTRAGQSPDAPAPSTLIPNGESRDIHRAGGRYVTLVGSNSLFHLPQDRWPAAVDVPAIARIAAGMAEVVAALGQ